jgi:hypothetical protein
MVVVGQDAAMQPELPAGTAVIRLDEVLASVDVD